MDGCIYRTKDGECDLYAEGGKFKAFCDMEHCDNIAPTNADRIRVMTVAEMAEFMAKHNACLRPKRTNGECEEYYDCKYCWLDWLKQEATDG